jgi:iron complex transport system substrate-binding protein
VSLRQPRLVALAALLLATAAPAAERLITLAPHLAELVCAAGGCAQLVAVSAYTDHPAEAAARPTIGDAYQVSLEALLALRPTRVLAWDGGTPPERVERLRELGVPVDAIAIRSLDDIPRVLRQLGASLGDPTVAEAAAKDFETRLAALRTRYRAARPLRVFYQIDTRPVFTVGGRSPISEALRVCGGENVFADLVPLAASVSVESLIATRIDAVVHGERDAEAIARFWSRLPVKAGRPPALIAVDADRLARASPRLLEVLEPLCGELELRRQSGGPQGAPGPK